MEEIAWVSGRYRPLAIKYPQGIKDFNKRDLGN